MSTHNTTDAIRQALQSKRGPALDAEMARRISATKVPANPNARHAAAMVLTRAIVSLPEKDASILDDLVLAITDENDVWIYDCLMAIMNRSTGEPIRPREVESTDKDDGKIISLIPGEEIKRSLTSEPDSVDVLAKWRAAARA